MDMGDVLARIASRAKELGLTEQGLSKAAGMSKDGIRNWRRRLEAGDETAGANVSSISKVAAALGVSEIWLLHGIEETRQAGPAIAVAGKAGAGAEVDLVDAYPKGEGLYRVPCPPQLAPHGIVAVEIRGDSMEPTYRQGGVVFYSRDVLGIPTEARNQICIAEDESGKVWLKHVKPSKEVAGLFDLVSLNPKVDTMFGAKLKWAAPVRLYLPPDLVARVE